MSNGTVIPQRRTAGGCGPKSLSKKMKRRKAQAKAKARRKASGKTKMLPVARGKRVMPAYDYHLSANAPPKDEAVEEAANTQEVRVIRRRTVW
jgi:hypothetical protein